MQNPPLLKAIFAELRASAGTEAAAGDLLRLAHLILRAYKSDFIEPVEEYRHSHRNGGFHSMAVDEAMNDGGWKILHFEIPGPHIPDEHGHESTILLHDRLTKFLGHEWQRLIPPG